MNIIKGWVTTIIGIIIIGLDTAYFFNFIKLHEIGNVSFAWRVSIAFVVGLVLLVFPITKIEAILEKIITKKTDKL